MEVCIDSVQSAINATKGGASRVELCSALSEGGLTPSYGMTELVCELCTLPVYVMIRPRAGDFLYSDCEFEVMKKDVMMLKNLPVTGFVFGILNSNGTVDVDRCQELVDLCRPKYVTFHRAIDMTIEPLSAIDDVIRLGCERVLTSGGESTALEGAPLIQKMIQKVGSRIIVVPGGGITANNLQRILDQTGAQEFHSSCRVSLPSQMTYQNGSVSMGATLSASEFSTKVTCAERVRRVRELGKTNVTNSNVM